MSKSSESTSQFLFVLFCSATITAVATAGFSISNILRNKKERRKDYLSLKYNDNDDMYYLNLCHRIRVSIQEKPRQSNFRVVCILLLDDGNGSWIPGTNDEQTVSIGGSICAERAALVQYRIQRQCSRKNSQAYPNIRTVYIVSDCQDMALPPGMLCREYMAGHENISMITTRIVLQAAYDNDSEVVVDSNIPEPLITSLEELYPFPSIYNKLSSNEQVKLGTFLCKLDWIQNCETITNIGYSQSELIAAARTAAVEGDDHIEFHPISYGAAAYVQVQTSDGTSAIHLLSASQKKALEYGGTQDAICQLIAAIQQYASSIENKDDCTLLYVVQTDQYGIPHAPFAPARSCLVEHGYGDAGALIVTLHPDRIKELLHLIDNDNKKATVFASQSDVNYFSSKQESTDDSSIEKFTAAFPIDVKIVPATDLAPFVPKFR